MSVTTVELGFGCSFPGSELSHTSFPGPDTGGSTAYVLRGTFPAGAVMQAEWDQVICDNGVNPKTPLLQLTDATNVFSSVGHPCGSGSGLAQAILPHDATELHWTIASAGDGTASYLNVRGLVSPCGPPCPYGTRMKTGTAFVYYLTPGLIDTWCVAAGVPWLAPVFTALYFSQFPANTVCASPPPPNITVDLSTLSASIATLLQLLTIVAWPTLCECVPGTPSPTPFPPPVIPEPPGWPAPPTFNCDPNELCATLTAIQQQLAAIASTLGENLGLTTLLQRYNLPFAYVPGAVHSMIVNAGTFAIDRLIGVRLEITQRPGGGLELPGTPPYLWDMGWVSISDANGMILEHRLTRDDVTWIMPDFPLATTFGYFLNAGVVLRVTELAAET